MIKRYYDVRDYDVFVINGELWKRNDLTIEEFAKEIHTSPDCWLFKKLKNPKCWKWTLYKSFKREDETVIIYEIYAENGRHSFKYMPEYNEIWHREISENNCGLWSTWKDLD